MTTTPDDLKRMRTLAESYLWDAGLLATALSKRSHADYLLQLTAFEILLKALRLSLGLPRGTGHKYKLLFEELPEPCKQRLLENAAERVGPPSDYSDPEKLLNTFAENFVRLRYEYEEYDGMTAAQVDGLGEEWIASGASDADASFAFYPEELFGLTEALRQELDAVAGSVRDAT